MSQLLYIYIYPSPLGLRLEKERDGLDRKDVRTTDRKTTGRVSILDILEA